MAEMPASAPHLPNQVPIDAYGDGGFRFSGMRHKGSMLCLPSGMHGWRPVTLEDVAGDDFALLAGEDGLPPFFLFGVGPNVAVVPDLIKQALDAIGLAVEVMDTGAACRTYNVLLAEDRPVAAALLQVP